MKRLIDAIKWWFSRERLEMCEFCRKEPARTVIFASEGGFHLCLDCAYKSERPLTQASNTQFTKDTKDIP